MQHQMQQEKMQEQQRLRQSTMPNTPNPNQPHQQMMPQAMPDASGAQSQVQQQNAPGTSMTSGNREKIWSGVLEWVEKSKTTSADKINHTVPCYVTTKEGESEMYDRVLILFS